VRQGRLRALFLIVASACGGRVDVSLGTPSPVSLDASPPVRDAAVTFDAAPPAPPTTLASNTYGALALALDETSVYWLDGSGSVQSVPKAGGAVQALTVAEWNEEPDSDALVVDATSVYWSTDEIYSAPKAGGQAVDLSAQLFGPNPSGGFAVDATRLYFTSSFVTTPGAALLAMPKGGREHSAAIPPKSPGFCEQSAWGTKSLCAGVHRECNSICKVGQIR
jgi:hypothetical protein